MKSIDSKARPPIIFIMGPSGCGKTTAINSCRRTDGWLRLSASAWIKNRFPQLDNESRASYSARLSSETMSLLTADPSLSYIEIAEIIDSALKASPDAFGVILDGVRNPIDFVNLYLPGDYCLLSSGNCLTDFEEVGLAAIEAIIQFKSLCFNDKSFEFCEPFDLLNPLEKIIQNYELLRSSRSGI